MGEGKLKIGGKGITAQTKRGLTFTFSGLLKNELFWDTRQLNADREGDSVNFPLDQNLILTVKTSTAMVTLTCLPYKLQ